MIIPETIRIIKRHNRIPPQAVKSIFVWKANKVKTNVTAAQIPTAITTDSVSK